MGLDVFFNRQAATAAGMQFQTFTKGQPEQIEKARLVHLANPDDAWSEDHYLWLQKDDPCLRVPGINWVSDGGHPDFPYTSVRANRWGNTYEPLTDWLKTHHIQWEEL